MTFTYSIVQTSKQLLLRVELARAPRDVGSFQIKDVYDRSN
jgi:hypothetical protein